MVRSAALTRLQQGLAALKADHLDRRRRLLDGAQGAHVTIDGRASFPSAATTISAWPLIRRWWPPRTLRVDAMRRRRRCGASHHRPSPFHDDFEAAFARFVGKPAALLFSTGYMANLGVLTALVAGRAKSSPTSSTTPRWSTPRSCRARASPAIRHGDLAQLEGQLAASTAQDKVIAIGPGVQHGRRPRAGRRAARPGRALRRLAAISTTRTALACWAAAAAA